jgi:outer membrane protein
MHKTLLKKLLIALIIVIPTLSAAADTAPAGEPKDASTAQSTAGTAKSAATDNKQAETAKVRHSAKVGYVDIVRIGSESDRGKALKALLTTKKEHIQGKIDEKKKQIEKYKTSIEAKVATMTPQQREAKSKEFQHKLEEFQKFALKSEEEFFTLQDKETKSLFEEIEKTAADHGKANGFSVIVIKKELLYVGSDVDVQDVTEDVIKALNVAGKKK